MSHFIIALQIETGDFTIAVLCDVQEILRLFFSTSNPTGRGEKKEGTNRL